MMSPLSIDDLPLEIIDIIFSYFNAQELNYIKNAPQFEAYAYRQLYSTVVIGKTSKIGDVYIPAIQFLFISLGLCFCSHLLVFMARAKILLS